MPVESATVGVVVLPGSLAGRRKCDAAGQPFRPTLRLHRSLSRLPPHLFLGPDERP
jgi:hypothetical protein